MTTDKPKNPPAFPVPNYVNADGETFASSPTGMTLRDYFASSALQGLLMLPIDSPKDDYAKDAYSFADAMLKARQS